MINFTNKIPVSFIVTILCLIIPIHATFAETVPVFVKVTDEVRVSVGVFVKVCVVVSEDVAEVVPVRV